MKHNSHHTALLILAIMVTLLVGASYTYMYYQVNSSVERAIKARDITVVQRAHKAREHELVATYESTAKDRGRLIGFFVPTDSTVQFIEAIESLGPVAGSEVTLSSIEDSPPESPKPGLRGSVHAHVDVRGSWSAVVKTLMLAEVLPYNVSINQIRLDSSLGGTRGSAREWRLAFDIQASTIVPPTI